MKGFIDDNFLLNTDTARALFHDYAKKMPIIDYHCHVNPHDIAVDKRYNSITEAWLAGDQCKWRLMRWCGVDEKYITGDAPDHEKFQAFAKSLPSAVGNPLYHRAHLELQRYFDCDLPLCSETADEIWRTCNRTLRRRLSAREMIRLSNVEVLSTTCDPIDNLDAFKKIAGDNRFHAKVLPTFRPDKAVAVNDAGYAEYIQTLSDVCRLPILTYDDLLDALASRLDYFVSCGCRLSDHSLDAVPWNFEPFYCDSIFERAMQGEKLTGQEAEAFQTAVMLSLGKEYANRGIVMQVHYNALRNVNPVFHRTLGQDAGFDCINTNNNSMQLAFYLGALEKTGTLPKTILYSLNPNDNAMLTCMAGCFQQAGILGKVQHGSAWWFNDTKHGIRSHLTTLAEMSILGRFIGTFTDSRDFMSYTKHEYFRRILCDLIGEWIENGEYRSDILLAGKIVEDISHNNAAEYLGL